MNARRFLISFSQIKDTFTTTRTVSMIPGIFLFSLFAQSWSQGHDDYTYFVQQVTEPVEHSEGPHWVESEQALYFVDIAGFGVHRYEPYTFKHSSVTLKDTVGVVIPIENQKRKFIIGYGKNISVLNWDGYSNKYHIENKYTVDGAKIGNRFNDGKADAKGRLWIGTMGEEKPVGSVKLYQGSLYRLSKKCELSNNVSPVSISNGMAWSADNSRMYYIDSPTRKIDVLDYNFCNGKISNRRTFFDFATNNITGVPDGMTIDGDDNIWVAVWGGSRVIQIKKDGKLGQTVIMPVERVTSVAWGGLDYDTLFVTTMRLGLSKSDLARQPNAGAVFKVIGLQAKGLPASSVTSCILTKQNEN